jgi:hypothetical protein
MTARSLSINLQINSSWHHYESSGRTYCPDPPKQTRHPSHPRHARRPRLMPQNFLPSANPKRRPHIVHQSATDQ